MARRKLCRRWEEVGRALAILRVFPEPVPFTIDTHNVRCRLPSDMEDGQEIEGPVIRNPFLGLD